MKTLINLVIQFNAILKYRKVESKIKMLHRSWL